jgi:hypothetical protein
MKLTDNQQRFLQEQITLWTGAPQDFKLPHDLAELILGVTETQTAEVNGQGLKDFQHNPLFWSGRLLEPVVNQWLAEKISRDSASPPVPLWPEGKRFAVCLTHDVDFVSHVPLVFYRQVKTNFRHFLRGKSGLGSLFINLAKILGPLAASGLSPRKKARIFEPWLEAEDRFGFRSTFFFFPDQASTYHPFDGDFYHFHDKVDFYGDFISVAQLLRELERQGWEIGLHGTFESFGDPVELRRQKGQLESCLQRPVVSIRQHCLNFDMHHTPCAQSQAGFKYDSTFGFNRIIGFRNGLALPFYHYNLTADAPLPILQIPLQVQDVALFRREYLDLSPEEALARSRELIAKVEKIGGLITLLWHPRSVDRKPYRSLWVYQELLADIATRDAWVAPVREVGEWWQKRQLLLKENGTITA